MDRSVRIGVTGKIGSGKSTMIKLMREAGMLVIDTDDLARKLMEEDESLRLRLIELLGPETYSGESLNRSFVASRIFSDTNLKLAVEACVHPLVSEHIEVAFLEAPSGTPVAVESALLLQTDLWASFDYIVLVNASDEAVIARVKSRGRLSESDIRARLREQGFDKVSREEADFILENNGTVEQFEKGAKAMVGLLRMLCQRAMPPIPLHQIPEEEI